jgi:positive regulator of sigma E activity
MLSGVEPDRPTRYRLAIIGMVPIVVLLVSLNVAPRLAGLLGLPKALGIFVACILAVVGFFVSRAILRREFAQRGSA